MYLCIFLFFRSIVKLKDGYTSTLPTFFYFQTNGTYYLISSNKDIVIKYIICNKSEYKKFQSDPNHDVSCCQNHELRIDDFDKGKIIKKGGYQFVFFYKNEEDSRKIYLENSMNKNNLINQTNNFGRKNIIPVNETKYIQERSDKKYFNDIKSQSANNYIEINNEIVVIFKNPASNLDYLVLPCLITKPLFAVLNFLILVIWIINWIMNFAKSCTIHVYLTLVISISLLFFFVQTQELYFRNHSDLFTSLMPLRILFLFIFQIVFYSTILMLAKGWFIVHKKLGKVKIVCCFFYSILLSLPQNVCQANFINKALGASLFKKNRSETCTEKEISNSSRSQILFSYFSILKNCSDISIWTLKIGWNITFIIIGIFGVILYYRDLIVSIEESSKYVIAHLLVISESGIDPYTTPVMEKYIIYKCLSWGILIYLASQLLIMIITQLFENLVYFWVQQLLFDIFNILGIIGCFLILKLNKNRLNGFMELNSSSDENGDETNISSLPNNPISENNFEGNQTNNPISENNFEGNHLDSNLLSPIENNEMKTISKDSNMNSSSNSIEMNLSDNQVVHVAPSRVEKRVVSIDEINNFNALISHRNKKSTSNNDESKDPENRNENNQKIKWEDWMKLPPQPEVSKRPQKSLRKIRSIDKLDESNDDNHKNYNIEEELIHQDQL